MNLGIGILPLSREWRDETVNIYASDKTEFKESSFVITRDKTEYGENLTAFRDRQEAQLSKQLAEFKMKSKETTQIDGRDCPYLEFTWSNPSGLMHQIVVFFPIDTEGNTPKRILVMTGTQIGNMTKSQRDFFANTMLNFKLNPEAIGQ